MKAKKLEVVYDDKTQQVTAYVTSEAAKKLRAATKRCRKGLKVSKSDIVTYCLLQSADSFALGADGELQTATVSANTGSEARIA